MLHDLASHVTMGRLALIGKWRSATLYLKTRIYNLFFETDSAFFVSIKPRLEVILKLSTYLW